MRCFLLLLTTACGPSSVLPEDTGSTEVDEPPAEPSSPWWEAAVEDLDGDGASRDQGDCDDTDPLVGPHVLTDVCDGVDADCDGEVDEDAPGDDWEPNDAAPAVLGDLTDVPETRIYGTLPTPDDVDRFELVLRDDSSSWFDLEAWLYGVPPDADYALELWHDGAPLASGDAVGAGGYEFVQFGGSFGVDDSGTYEVVVSSQSGSGCAYPYTLQIVVGSW